MKTAARRRHITISVLFFLALVCVLYFALTPNVRRDVLSVPPGPVRSWCGENDDLANFALFTVLGLLGFHRPLAAKEKSFDAARFPILLMLVVSLEVAQLWIPGRFSSLRDVATGSSGVLLAWLVNQWIRRRPASCE